MADQRLLEVVQNSPSEALDLLLKGGDPDAADSSGTPAVILAVEEGCEDAALSLINAGCAVNVAKQYSVRQK